MGMCQKMRYAVLLLDMVSSNLDHFHCCLRRTSKLTRAACIVWYFFNDVYPSLHDDHRPFDPPMWWRRIFEGRPAENTDASPIDNEIAAAAAPDVR